MYEIKTDLDKISSAFAEIISQIWPEVDAKGSGWIDIDGVRIDTVNKTSGYRSIKLLGVQLSEKGYGSSNKRYRVMIKKGEIDLDLIRSRQEELAKLGRQNAAIEKEAERRRKEKSDYLERFRLTLGAPKLGVDIASLEEKTFKINLKGELSEERVREFVAIVGSCFPELLYEPVKEESSNE